MIQTEALWWIAGFLEGEGSFIIRPNRPTAIVGTGQVQREPLERLRQYLGGWINPNRHKSTARAKPYWNWTLSGAQAAGLCMTIYRLMSPRRQEQIRKVMAQWRQGRTHNLYKTKCIRGHAFDAENTYIIPSSGGRACRICSKRRNKNPSADRISEIKRAAANSRWARRCQPPFAN